VAAEPIERTAMIGGEMRASTCQDDDDEIVRKIKIDPLTFDGVYYLMVFSDWLTDMDYYFNWYRISEEFKVRLARM